MDPTKFHAKTDPMWCRKLAKVDEEEEEEEESVRLKVEDELRQDELDNNPAPVTAEAIDEYVRGIRAQFPPLSY